MSKWYGTIGYMTTAETKPGVWSDVVVEVQCYGDMNRNHKRWNSGTNINDDITLQNELSIIYDPNSVVPGTICKTLPIDLIEKDGYLSSKYNNKSQIKIPISEVFSFQNIRYVGFMNTCWKVTAVDVQYPRLILSIGGVYNGKQA